MKIKELHKESTKSYRRLNIGDVEKETKMTSEVKRAFLEAVSAYKKFGETIYRNGDLMETYGAIKTIVENANKVTLEETGEWFDRVTVNRHMKSMNESFKVFQKTLSYFFQNTNVWITVVFIQDKRRLRNIFWYFF